MYLTVKVAQRLTEFFKEKNSNVTSFSDHLVSRYWESQRYRLGYLQTKKETGRKDRNEGRERWREGSKEGKEKRMRKLADSITRQNKTHLESFSYCIYLWCTTCTTGRFDIYSEMDTTGKLTPIIS